MLMHEKNIFFSLLCMRSTQNLRSGKEASLEFLILEAVYSSSHLMQKIQVQSSLWLCSAPTN